MNYETFAASEETSDVPDLRDLLHQRRTMNDTALDFTLELLSLLRKVQAGFTPDPGHSDLDNCQPIYVLLELGDYRKINQLLG
jgi:hypothetical protein